MTPTAEGRLTPCEVKLSNDLHALKATVEAFQGLMDERGRLYDERHTTNKEMVKAAFDSAEKAVLTALTAQKEAVIKAEEAQRAYNTSHNDLLRKQELMIPRPEFVSAVERVSERIDETKAALASLDVSRGKSTGKDEGLELAKANQRLLISIGVPLLLFVLGLAAKVFFG